MAWNRSRRTAAAKTGEWANLPSIRKAPAEAGTCPNVRSYAVDYVSGSVDGASASKSANGYVGSGFTVLADTKNQVLSAYAATMGTTVVIDNTGLVRMNEDYRRRIPPPVRPRRPPVSRRATDVIN